MRIYKIEETEYTILLEGSVEVILIDKKYNTIVINKEQLKKYRKS